MPKTHPPHPLVHIADAHGDDDVRPVKTVCDRDAPRTLLRGVLLRILDDGDAEAWAAMVAKAPAGVVFRPFEQVLADWKAHRPNPPPATIRIIVGFDPASCASPRVLRRLLRKKESRLRIYASSGYKVVLVNISDVPEDNELIKALSTADTAFVSDWLKRLKTEMQWDNGVVRPFEIETVPASCVIEDFQHFMQASAPPKSQAH